MSGASSRAAFLMSAALACSMPVPAIAQDVATLVTLDPVRVQDGTADGLVLRLTYPQRSKGRMPVVIFSHGNRLSRQDYQPVVRALAAAGYLVVQPDHVDASEDGFAPKHPQPADTWLRRVDQLRWVADNLQGISAHLPGFRGRVDTSRIALIGHSFGGHSAALAMGAAITNPATGAVEQHAIPNIRSAILLAPPGDFAGLAPEWRERAPYLKLDWRTMRGAVLTIAGESDSGGMTNQGAVWHEAPFHLGPASGVHCLLRVPGGHYLGGIDTPHRMPAGDATPERRARVLDAILAFLAETLPDRDRAGGSDTNKFEAKFGAASICR